MVKGPEFSRKFIGQHVDLVRMHIRRELPMWRQTTQEEHPALFSHEGEDIETTDTYAFVREKTSDPKAWHEVEVELGKQAQVCVFSWVDIAHICPAKSVVLVQQFWPYWVPFVGGTIRGQKSVSGILTAYEVPSGWLFRHPGFDNGKFFLPLTNLEGTPGGGSPHIYFV
jgi:hypothetical protein